MPGRILVSLCLPPWKDRSPVHSVSYLLTPYERLRCLRGVRWHYVSVFRQLYSHQCCNWAFKSVCPNVEDKHLSSVLFYPCLHCHCSALVKKSVVIDCRVANVYRVLLFHGSLVLILLHPGCLSLRSGCALSFLAAALGAGGKPRCVSAEGGCCVPEDASGQAVGVMAAWGHRGSAPPVAWTYPGRFWKAAWFLLTRYDFKIVPWKSLSTSFGLLLESSLYF